MQRNLRLSPFTLRKLVKPLALAALVCLFAACSSNNNKANNAATTGAAAPTTASTVANTAAPAGTAARTGTAAPTATTAAAGSPTAAAAAITTPVGTPSGPTVGQGDPRAAALAAAGGKKLGGSVSVLGSWGGAEQDSFMAMVKPFEDATGVTVQYEGTRDLNAVLTTRVQGNNPPDLAGLPGPGTMAQFAQQGKLVDLSTVLDTSAMQNQYPQSWLQLGQVNGKQIGIFIKAALKGPIWYDPKTFDKVSGGTMPKTWDDLTALSNKIAQSGTTPWCMAVESGATSGWPAADFMQDIMLRQYGPDVYDQWYQGKLSWTSDQVKTVWQMWGKIATDPKMVFGGTATILSTNFGDVGNPMFSNPPKCYMVHQGDFITDFFIHGTPGIKPVTDFNFFMFPDINPQYAASAQVAGDLFGMFKDTPQARALIKYLTTPEAQSIWVKRGGALSPNKMVTLDVYPDQIAKEEAQVITSAKTVRFSADDLMPGAMEAAFEKAVLDYLQNPSNLDSILSGLDQVRSTSYNK